MLDTLVVEPCAFVCSLSLFATYTEATCTANCKPGFCVAPNVCTKCADSYGGATCQTICQPGFIGGLTCEIRCLCLFAVLAADTQSDSANYTIYGKVVRRVTNGAVVRNAVVSTQQVTATQGSSSFEMFFKTLLVV